MRDNRPSGSEGGAGFQSLLLPLSTDFMLAEVGRGFILHSFYPVEINGLEARPRGLFHLAHEQTLEKNRQHYDTLFMSYLPFTRGSL